MCKELQIPKKKATQVLKNGRKTWADTSQRADIQAAPRCGAGRTLQALGRTGPSSAAAVSGTWCSAHRPPPGVVAPMRAVMAPETRDC